MRERIFLLATLLASSSLSLASGAPTAPTEEDASVFGQIISQIEQSGDFPEGRPAIVSWLVKPRRATGETEPRAVGVAHIKFKGLVNSYCRIVSVETDRSPAVTLVPTPDNVNYDACTGVRSLHSGDLNGDGKTDYWYVVRVPSNRYPTYVDDVLAFLGQPGMAGALCYSSSASRAIRSVAPSPVTTVHSVSNFLKRDGQELIKCD